MKCVNLVSVCRGEGEKGGMIERSTAFVRIEYEEEEKKRFVKIAYVKSKKQCIVLDYELH